MVVSGVLLLAFERITFANFLVFFAFGLVCFCSHLSFTAVLLAAIKPASLPATGQASIHGSPKPS